MSRTPALFSEKQSLQRWHTRVILAFPPGALVFIACRQLIWHKPWGSPPLSDGGLLFLTVLLAAVYFRLTTVKLVTELWPGELLVAMRGLWRHRRIPLGEIRSVQAVDRDPAAEFGGYGIRSTKRGTAYIARGNGGVELMLANGQRVVIGSQNPAELARKIREARSHAAA